MKYLAKELFRHSVMTPLQQLVYELDVCAHCHKKTMRHVHTGGGMVFSQCETCKRVAVLPSNGGSGQ